MLGYLTTAAMPEADRMRVDDACRLDDDLLQTILSGDIPGAMNRLHKPADQEASAAEDGN